MVQTVALLAFRTIVPTATTNSTGKLLTILHVASDANSSFCKASLSHGYASVPVVAVVLVTVDAPDASVPTSL